MKTWTPNEADFCSCGGVIGRKSGICQVCGARRGTKGLYEPGPHDWGGYDLPEESDE